MEGGGGAGGGAGGSGGGGFGAGGGGGPGTVRVFSFLNGKWVQKGSDLTSDTNGDMFGGRVSLSSDGSILAVGATGDSSGGIDSGTVFIYEWNGSSWDIKGSAIIGDSSGDMLSGRGKALEISSDGSTVIVGSSDFNSDKGIAKVYKWDGSASWGKLGGDFTGSAGDDLGWATAISSDGTIIAVSSRDAENTGSNKGIVQIYEWDGSSWSQKGSDIEGEANSDRSGSAISMSNDGSVISIGAYGNDDGGLNAGHVRVFAWDGSSWSQRGNDFDGDANDSNWRNQLSGDGSTLAIGQVAANSQAGQVKVYEWDGSSWSQKGTTLAGETSDMFGGGLSLSDDGSMLGVGSSGADTYGSSDNVGSFKIFKFNSTDVTAPTITGVTSSTSDGTFIIGDSISISISFSDSVNVVTTGGTPTLELETGTTNRTATYSSGTGTSTLVFTYTVQSGDTATDLDYVSTSSLALNSGTIKDASGNDANLTLASPGASGSLANSKAFVIDGNAPTISGVTSSTSDGTFKIGDSISISVSFSDSVNVVTTGGTPTLDLETGTTNRTATYSSGTGTSTLVFTYTVQSGDTATDLDYVSTSSLALNSGTIKDASGNDATLTLATPGASGSLAYSKAFVIDGIAPTFTSGSTNTTGTKVILTYNETLSATTAATSAFSVTTAGASNSVTDATVSGSTVELTLTTAVKNDEAVTVTYIDPSGSDDANAIQDAAGNDVATLISTSVTNNSTVAGTPPTLLSSSPVDDASSITTSSNIVLTFSEAVDLETGNIVIYKASDDSVVETFDVASSTLVTGTGTNTITINPTSDLAEQTSYYIQIAGTAFDDIAGNSYVGINSVSTFSFTTADETAPTFTSTTPANGATSVATSTNLSFTFSEAVVAKTGNLTIYNSADDSVFATISVSDTSLVSGSGTSTITVDPLSDLEEQTSYYAYIDATAFDDIAGNSLAGVSDKTSYTFTTADETAPTLSSTSSTSISENTTSVHTYTTDETVTWSLNGGNDSALFAINSSTGALTFTTAPDYESPTDSDSNNTYVVVVRATDAASNTSDQTLTVSVSDVDDNPTYSLSTSINVPQENYSLTTTVNTSYVDTGTTLYWSVSGTNVDLADFSTGDLTGSDTVASDGTFSFTHFIANDGSTEGYETFDIKLFSDSGRTTQVGDTKSILIRDSAITEQIAEINSELSTITAMHTVGQQYTLAYIRDYDGNLHANSNEVADTVKSSYKYQGMIDVNADSISEAIYTNKESGRWVTASIDSTTGNADFTDYGQNGTTRIVGIYIDPLVTSGEVVAGSDHDSQRRFQNDLEIDNLLAKTSGDYDGDGFQEVYWKTVDGTAYLRALMHDDGNIQYSNYQSESQMSDYLTTNGYESTVSEITS